MVGLVFVAAFAPDDGEWLGDVTARSKDAILGPALLQRKYPIGRDGETGVEFVVNPARFHEVFAADLPADLSAILAAGQRPIAQSAFSEKAGPPAWKSIESWAVVARGDKAAGADIVRSMAQRAGAKIVEVEALQAANRHAGSSGQLRRPAASPHKRGKTAQHSLRPNSALLIHSETGRESLGP